MKCIKDCSFIYEKTTTLLDLVFSVTGREGWMIGWMDG